MFVQLGRVQYAYVQWGEVQHEFRSIVGHSTYVFSSARCGMYVFGGVGCSMSLAVR